MKGNQVNIPEPSCGFSLNSLFLLFYKRKFRKREKKKNLKIKNGNIN